MIEEIEKKFENMNINKIHKYLEWREIPFYDRYAISSMGDVKNLETLKILKKVIRKGEYHVRLDDKYYKVSELMLKVFFPRIDYNYVIQFIDGNCNNLYIENIRVKSLLK